MSLAALGDQLVIRVCCHGLSGRDLARLECVAPLFSLRSSPLARDDGDVCAICLEALGDAIDCTVMPCCRVEIHAHCLASWCEAAAVHTAAAGRLTSAV